ncbi:MAG TPA: FGGY-family carbohydrate kinase [Acidimicrobiales bacterium]|nr:FGGY-family carbohydrate kinase [Acidimicrobiales bacterium]
MSILVVDAGTSGVRAAIVRPDGAVEHVHRRATLPFTPAPGFVEIDAVALAEAALYVARRSLADGGPVEAVGIANQRASTIVWDRATGVPVAPGIGWQDLRTVPLCLMLRANGVRLAPQASATKLAVILGGSDPERERDLCFGTVDSWLAWTLSAGRLHVTDATNAAVTGMVHLDASGWDDSLLEGLNVPVGMLPTIVDSTGLMGTADALPGAPPIGGIAGDQQASLVGQGCTRAGLAKATFGTGGMLDLCVGAKRPEFDVRGEHGCFPIVAWRRDGADTWGIEAVMLSAGSCVEWLRDDLGILASVGESEEVARASLSRGEVWFVPALHGLGTPRWDFGARGTLLGLTRGAGRAEIVRAVLDGVAHRGADLVEAAEADAGVEIASLRVDGGMTANAAFLQALADATQRPIEVSPIVEATTLGAAYLAGMSVGTWSDEEDIARLWRPRTVLEPRRRLDRDGWLQAVERAAGTVPELSALEF